MKKDEAIEKLKRQIDLIDNLKTGTSYSPEHKKWLRDTEVAIQHIFESEGRHLGDFRTIRYSYPRVGATDDEHQKAYLNGLDEASLVLKSFIQEINDYWEGQVGKTAPNALAIVERLCRRFHLVARQLRSRHNGRETLEIEDEYDVQDLLHALLTIYFDDIRPEEWTPSYAGSSSRMDFLLKQEKIVIEAKKTRKGLGAKEVGEQLLIDIQKYKEHPYCSLLVCFVYDPEGRIGNPRGIENDLNKSYDGLPVKVLITPTGV